MWTKLTISKELQDRWIRYHAQNPVWTFNELVARLLENHFNEADAMLKAIAEHEEKQRRHE